MHSDRRNGQICRERADLGSRRSSAGPIRDPRRFHGIFLVPRFGAFPSGVRARRRVGPRYSGYLTRRLLNDARELHERGEFEAALEVLLERWAEVRNPDLATAIEHICASIERPALSGRTRARRRREWMEIADEATPHDYTRLLNALPTFTCAQATELLDRTEEWVPSPVVFSALLDIVGRPPKGYQGQGKEAFWKLALQRMKTHGDPRALRELTALPDRFRDARWVGAPESGLPTSVAYLIDEIPGLAQQIRALPTELSEDEHTECVRLTARVDARRSAPEYERHRADLVEQVHRDPSDDEVRLVLADVLSELGDPRGEFIVLQMARAHGETTTKAMRERERALLLANQRAWLGAIEPAVGRSGLIYRRGFAAAGKIDAQLIDDPSRMFALPEWRTFETLDLTHDEAPGVQQLLGRPDLQALRRIHNAPGWIFEMPGEFPVEELRMRHTPYPEQLREARRVFPNLQVLDCGHDFPEPYDLEPLWAPGVPTVRHLALHAQRLGTWVTRQSTSIPIETIRIQSTPYRATLCGTAVVLKIEHYHGGLGRFPSEDDSPLAWSLGQQFEGADLSFVSNLEIQLAKGIEIPNVEAQQVVRVLESLGAQHVHWAT